MASQPPYALERDTGARGYAADALPFKDMPEHQREPQYVVQNGEVLLKGSRSRSSGAQAFPQRAVCLETGARDMEPMEFGPHGVLYTFSTVHVSATRATPYTIGYVDFPNGVRVLANIDADVPPGELACDMPVVLRAAQDNWYVTPASRAGITTLKEDA